ncbi:MAG: hypothetical protein JW798_08610 [Prolixibacteraceae bacterium]|nr:hypothetical protein [Prolixibacteraceae bacterium]
MKKQILLAIAIMFTLSLAAPAIAVALNNDSPVVMLENDEKKKDKTKEAKTSDGAKTEGCADVKKAEAKTEGCADAAKAEAKPCDKTKKSCCGSKAKTE